MKNTQMAKVKTKNRYELRITDIPEEKYKAIKKQAKENCRTMVKEVLHSIIKIY